jgi:hypothetical protein
MKIFFSRQAEFLDKASHGVRWQNSLQQWFPFQTFNGRLTCSIKKIFGGLFWDKEGHDFKPL